MVNVKGIPLDAPLYDIDPERGVEYWGCEWLAAFFVVAGDVAGLLPPGLRLASDPPLGGVVIAHYGNSTLGEYHEFVSLLQVVGVDGKVGLYVPYIYVDNDAAMAAGRETIGAPKKLAHVTLSREFDLIQGTMERPAGKRLVTFTFKPTSRLPREALDAIVAPGTPMYSLRHTPTVEGGVSQLVQWFTDVSPHTDAFGDAAIFTGPAALTYDSPSAIDPIHRLGVGQLLAAVSMHFDARLRPGAVVPMPAEARQVSEGVSG